MGDEGWGLARGRSRPVQVGGTGRFQGPVERSLLSTFIPIKEKKKDSPLRLECPSRIVHLSVFTCVVFVGSESYRRLSD